MGQYFEAARMRIRNIDWEYEDRYRPSHVLLVSEFRRRGKVFLDYVYKMNSDYAHLSPSIKFLVYYGPAKLLKADLPINIRETCFELKQIPGLFPKFLCTYYLELAYLVDQKNPTAIQFQDLYDPIIKLYESGGRINEDKGALECGLYWWSFSTENIKDLSPIDISDETLEECDNQWYYSRIIAAVKNHIKNNNSENESAEEIASAILERLQNCSKYSKNLVFWLELAELLLNKGIHSDWLIFIKNRPLYQFKIDYLEKYLSEDEKNALLIRVSELVNRLNRLDEKKILKSETDS